VAVKWLTSDTLIASVLRRAQLPLTQNTFTETDLLAFANEEMDMGITPHILQYHEDYLINIEYLPVSPGQSYYEIPSRSTGNKFRMVHYVDPNGNVFEMTRVSIEDLPYYQNSGFGLASGLRAFFIENDEIVVLPLDRHSLVGWLQVSYYLSPNVLVPTNTVSTITGFNPYTGVLSVSSVPSNLASPIPMDILQTRSPHKRLAIDVTPSAVSSASNTITFGVAPITNVGCTAKSAIPSGSYFNLVANGATPQKPYYTQDNDIIIPNTLHQNVCVWYDLTGGDATPVVSADIFIRVNLLSANTADDVALATSAAINAASLEYYTTTPITGGILQINTTLVGTFSQVDVNPGLPFLINIINTPTDVIPQELQIGDYVAASNESIIPNVPTELHSMLAQRVACRCLEALGDMQGLQMANQKLAEMELKTGSLIDNRAEGSPLKVVNRHGFLRQSRRMLRR